MPASWRKHGNLAAMEAACAQDLKVLASPQDHADEADQDPLLEKYEIGGRIGQGSFGKVYRGYHKSSGAPVALKFATLDDDPEVANREVQLLKRLRHGGIIPLLEHFDPEPVRGRRTAVLVFPEREGDLHRFIRRRQADVLHHRASAGLSVTRGAFLDRSTVELWASQLASGLAYMHSQSTIHRDLKPGNVLLVWQGAGTRVELADFGAARETPAPAQKLRNRSKKAVDLANNAVTAQIRCLNARGWHRRARGS